MIYYALLIHFLWAVYALFVNKSINRSDAISVPWYKNALAFLLNFVLCPVGIVIAAYNEYSGEDSLL